MESLRRLILRGIWNERFKQHWAEYSAAIWCFIAAEPLAAESLAAESWRSCWRALCVGGCGCCRAGVEKGRYRRYRSGWRYSVGGSVFNGTQVGFEGGARTEAHGPLGSIVCASATTTARKAETGASGECRSANLVPSSRLASRKGDARAATQGYEVAGVYDQHGSRERGWRWCCCRSVSRGLLGAEARS